MRQNCWGGGGPRGAGGGWGGRGIVEQFDVYLCPPTVAIHPERNSCTHYLDTASVLSGVMAVVVV